MVHLKDLADYADQISQCVRCGACQAHCPVYRETLGEGSVARALHSQTGRQASVQGLGKRQPVAPNTTPEGRDDPQGRQLNRRVQILIGLPHKEAR